MTRSSVFEVSGATDTGRVRDHNEDTFLVDEELGLFVVADGMGGHNAGEVASALAVKTVGEMARRIFKASGASRERRAGLNGDGRHLESFVLAANAAIFQKGQESVQQRGMGTTIVALLADQKAMTVAHVGDSRLYLFREGRLSQMTRDHSLVEDQVSRGLITPEEALRSDYKNVLTRALGTEEKVEVDVGEYPLFPGDILILATDGLCKMVSDAKIEAVAKESVEPAKITARLIAEAVSAGGLDNVTVVTVGIQAPKAGGFKGLLSHMLGKK